MSIRFWFKNRMWWFLSNVDDVADGNLNQATEGWLHLGDVMRKTHAFVKQ
jgi:hypothetical protein